MSRILVSSTYRRKQSIIIASYLESLFSNGVNGCSLMQQTDLEKFFVLVNQSGFEGVFLLSSLFGEDQIPV